MVWVPPPQICLAVKFTLVTSVILHILVNKLHSTHSNILHECVVMLCKTWGTCSLGFTNLFSLQGGHRVPEAVKAVFDVVPTLALQRIVVCPLVCLQWKESQGLQPGSRAVWAEDSGGPAIPDQTYTNHSAAKSHSACTTATLTFSVTFIFLSNKRWKTV